MSSVNRKVVTSHFRQFPFFRRQHVQIDIDIKQVHVCVSGVRARAVHMCVCVHMQCAFVLRLCL